MARHTITITERSGTGGRTSRTQPGSTKGRNSRRKKTWEEKASNKGSSYLKSKAKPASAIALGGAVNEYMGQYTRNAIATKRRRTALTYGALGIFAFSNPISAGGSAFLYTTDKIISYSIDISNMGVTSNYMKELSGGTVNQSRRKGAGL